MNQKKRMMENTFDVEVRIRNDAVNIKKICSKYLGSVNPWLPINPQMPQIQWNYFHDKRSKIGWCFNPKVSKIVCETWSMI